VQTAGGEKRGHAADVVRRADRVDVEGDETQSLQRSDPKPSPADTPPQAGVHTPGAQDGSKKSMSKHR